jgi:hypothetical protein
MHRLLTILVIGIVLTAAHFVTAQQAARAWSTLPQADEPSFVLPTPVLKITALEFDGVASDVLLIRALMFIGSTQERAEISDVKKAEWKWFYDTLNASTDMDPYFEDAYYLSNAILTWDAGMVQEANMLLVKGSRYRTWDADLPFFLGFNHFYFLKDNKTASEYLMDASRRPGAKPLFANLAVKLASQENRTESAINFMKEMIGKTEDKVLLKKYETRLRALEATFSLEKGVERYRRKFGRLPHRIEDLVDKHVIDRVPDDPYHGSFYLGENGVVRSTNDQMGLPQRHKAGSQQLKRTGQ